MTEHTLAHSDHSIPQQLGLLALLLALVIIAYVLSPEASETSLVLEDASVPLSTNIRRGAAAIPEFTEATKRKLENSSGFQSLVSYTDNGFEPSVLAINAGDTVRFTNNSSGYLWVAAHGANGKLYPRTRQGCGSSDLDSCEPIHPMDFWEFTFTVPGTWDIANNLDESQRVVVTVIVE